MIETEVEAEVEAEVESGTIETVAGIDRETGTAITVPAAAAASVRVVAVASTLITLRHRHRTGQQAQSLPSHRTHLHRCSRRLAQQQRILRKSEREFHLEACIRAILRNSLLKWSQRQKRKRQMRQLFSQKWPHRRANLATRSSTCCQVRCDACVRACVVCALTLIFEV